jgi:UDP-N-acetyl-D-mannosaminuronic acid transferase (WecB/TagA/CpsF family)
MQLSESAEFRIGTILLHAPGVAVAVEHLHALAQLGRGADVHFVNAYSLVLADSDPRLRSRLREAAINFCDGVPPVWFGRAVTKNSA